MIVSSRLAAVCCLCALLWATELAAQVIPLRPPPGEPSPPGRVQPFERIPRPLPDGPSTQPARPSAGRPPSRPTFHPPIAPPAFSTSLPSPAGAPADQPLGPAIVFGSPAPTAWFRAEYVQFYLANAPLAGPLVTASDVADQGRLGSPSTSVLLGDHRQPLGGFSGIRLTGGSWFGGERRRGAEVSAFILPGHARDFDVASAALGDRSTGTATFGCTAGT